MLSHLITRLISVVSNTQKKILLFFIEFRLESLSNNDQADMLGIWSKTIHRVSINSE